MILWEGLPGQNNGGPADYHPLGDPLLSMDHLDHTGDFKFVAAEGLRHGVKVHLGTKMHGYVAPGTVAHPAPFNGAAPQHDWLTDDVYWNSTILVGIRTMARQAKTAGYSGLFFDEELSSSNDGWSYAGYKLAFPASTLTQAQAEAAATARGKSWMQAIVSEFPEVEYTNYSASSWPSGYSNYMRFKNNPIYPPSLQNYFYKGVLSAPGYAHVWFLNADFYGGQYFPALPIPLPYGGKLYDRWQWGTVQFDRDQTNKFWDTFLDPATDRTKVDIVPFVAIAQIETGQYDAYKTKSLSMVGEQIVPSIKQNINPGQRPVPLFGHYAYGSQAEVFDYSPYRPALRDATGVARTVDVTISDGVSTVTVPVTIQ